MGVCDNQAYLLLIDRETRTDITRKEANDEKRNDSRFTQ